MVSFYYGHSKNFIILKAGAMTQKFRVLSTSVEDIGLITSMHT